MSISEKKKKKPEPEEKLLTLRPTVRYTMERGGFCGWLYRADPNLNPGSVIILLGGGDGLYSRTKYAAEQFTKSGINALALAWWNQEGLPEEQKEIPLDTIERAAERMKTLGLSRILLLGSSMGAVAALNTAVRRPELFAGIISINGVDFTPQSIRMEGRKILGVQETSLFTWHGTPLPWEPLTVDPKRIRRDSIRKLEMNVRSCFEGKEQTLKNPESRIRVEELKSPLLCITGGCDSIWPASECAARMMKTLDEKETPCRHMHLNYPLASHNLLPVKTVDACLFRVERKNPEICEKSRQEAFQQTMIFIKQIP